MAATPTSPLIESQKRFLRALRYTLANHMLPAIERLNRVQESLQEGVDPSHISPEVVNELIREEMQDHPSGVHDTISDDLRESFHPLQLALSLNLRENGRETEVNRENNFALLRVLLEHGLDVNALLNNKHGILRLHTLIDSIIRRRGEGFPEAMHDNAKRIFSLLCEFGLDCEQPIQVSPTVRVNNFLEFVQEVANIWGNPVRPNHAPYVDVAGALTFFNNEIITNSKRVSDALEVLDLINSLGQTPTFPLQPDLAKIVAGYIDDKKLKNYQFLEKLVDMNRPNLEKLRTLLDHGGTIQDAIKHISIKKAEAPKSYPIPDDLGPIIYKTGTGLNIPVDSYTLDQIMPEKGPAGISAQQNELIKQLGAIALKQKSENNWELTFATPEAAKKGSDLIQERIAGIAARNAAQNSGAAVSFSASSATSSGSSAPPSSAPVTSAPATSSVPATSAPAKKPR